ncbi:MAG: type I 3-dehydroquinate dehydratase [Desulfatiglandaceae bacterium]|jgi:3-dehydroquinate dehydratase type I
MKIAVSIAAQDTAGVVAKMARASELAEVFEIRLDLMASFDLKQIIRNTTKPVIVTYRSRKEGGRGLAHYATRVSLLQQAVAAGAAFVDVEFSMPLGFRESILRNRKESRVILSHHILNGTPSRKALGRLLDRMAASGPDVIKIVTRARNAEDNLRVLNLIPKARELGTEIIAFCMGREGRISRIASPLMGGYLTFASLGPGEEAAAGQIPARTMVKILKELEA